MDLKVGGGEAGETTYFLLLFIQQPIAEVSTAFLALKFPHAHLYSSLLLLLPAMG